MTRLELLAPARDLACGIAAIDHGADAVYIGAAQFGARAAAGNSVADIEKLCHYAHTFSVKVYVTVNTIIYDDELEATQRLLQQLYEAGVDAVLVQDMGILNLQRPPLPLHASTQTDNRTADKVRWLQNLGFRRVVLARELSADEVAAIHQAVPDMELEVFVHGALCVSYSGLCYASQHCFGRSANRGTCAQLCRMQYDLLDADGKELEHQRHLLSLKDLNLHDHLEQLIDAGATSFKIEGRLKDEAYVKNVTAAYSQQLDRIVSRHPDRYCRTSRGHCTYTFTPDLNKSFNRGFTTYFLNGRQPNIFSPYTPKAMGEYVGKVKEIRRDSFTVAGTASFANGDGLCIVSEEGTLVGFRINRAEGNRLYPQHMPGTALHAGMPVYRNYDQTFLRLLSKTSAVRKIPVTLSFATTADGFSLSCGEVSVSVPCEHQTAARPQHDNIVRQLSKLGNTIYECTEVKLADDFSLFVPNSVLSTLKHLLVDALSSSTVGQGKNIPATHSTTASDDNGEWALHSEKGQGNAYRYDYLYNIANKLSQQFYGADTLTAYELHPADGPVMQCRHCLRYAMGFCVRHGGRHPQWKEPLTLRLANGRRFRLEFDCQHCQMNVYAIHHA